MQASPNQIQSQAPTLNPALRDFWLTPARNRVLYGGRDSSKSWDAAGFAVFLAQHCKIRVCCARQFQNKIAESVYTLLKIQIERFGLTADFKITDNSIIHRRTGSEFLFYGLWRHIDEIKSLEGIDILWIEEAHNLTEDQWKILEPTIRKEGSQVWVIFNPKLATDFTYKRFVINPPPDTVKRLINYTENPFLSRTSRKIIEALKAEDIDSFQHVYMGVPMTDDDGVIIRRSWIEASIDADKALGFSAEGAKRLGFDVADGGADKCANVFAHGSVVGWADEWKAKEDELLKSCTRAYDAARDRNASIAYDSIGVGAMAGSKFQEINMLAKAAGSNFQASYQKFNAGGTVHRPDDTYQPGITNKDMFANIKAQAWWMVADRFRNTYNAVRKGETYTVDKLISISSDCPFLEKMIDELSTPKRDYDQNGRVKVESKKDLAKANRPGGPVPSPNIADAFIMCFPPGGNALDIWAALAA
jgi:phage terminase large subunit